MAFIGALGEEYHYLVDKNGDIWSLDGKIYYGNKKNIQGLKPIAPSTSSVFGLGDLGITTYERLQRSPAVVAAKQAVIAKRRAFYQQNINNIISSLPKPIGKWYQHYEHPDLLDPYNVAMANLTFKDSGLDAYPPYPYPLPPKNQWVPPQKEFATIQVQGTISLKQRDGSTLIETVSYPVSYQTGWGIWRTRQALHGWGLVEHAIAYALPAIAIVAAPFALAAIGLAPGAVAAAGGAAGTTGAVGAGGAAVAAGGAGAEATAGGLTMSEIVAGAGGAGTAAAGGGGGILATMAAALPSAATLETAATGVSTVVGVGQKLTQAQAAKKQAAEQQAQAQQVTQQMAQAQAAQDIAQEVKNTIDAGQPITQDLVNRAAKAGIKLSPTGTMVPMEAGMFAGISSKNLPYLIGGGIALTIIYYLFIEKKK